MSRSRVAGQPVRAPRQRDSLWLYDEVHWTDALGRVHVIAEMPTEHARACKNLLLHKAQVLVKGMSWRAWTDAMSHDGGEMAQDSLDRIADELDEACRTVKGSVDVIKTTPVFRALKKRARAKA